MDETPDILERMRAHQRGEESPSEETRAKHALADAIRGLCHALLRSEASPEAMRAMATDLAAHREVLAARQRARDASVSETPVAIGGMEDFRDRGPIAGRSNPIAAPLSLAPDPDAGVVVGEVTFGPAFEGAPGCVHGGFVAAVLDEALGMACIFSGGPGMTGELTTRYLRHTPLESPLRVEARLVSVDGRKLRTTGEVTCNGEVVAEGSGLFIAVDNEKFRRLAAAHIERQSGG